ncbi:MAG TPA: FAD:protein FMN transferase, partial [Candidatus Dormibacteraeota bacterium]
MPEPSIAVATSRALGTGVQVAVTDERQLEQAMALVLEWLARLDRAASRFRPDSELSRLNAAGGGHAQISPLLARVLDTALQVAAMTGGLVDPTVGASMDAIGYDRDFAEVQASAGEARGAGETAPGWERVRLDVSGGTVEVPPGTRIDVGASAKAFAADETAALAA